MNLLIKFPTRERPEVFRKCLIKYIELADNINDVQFLFSLDSNDPKLQENIDVINDLTKGLSTTCIGISNSKIHAVNRDINEMKLDWDVLLLASDDMFPQVQGYDTIIKKEYATKNATDFYLWTSDGRQNRISTLSIMGKEYYNRFNYIYHPDYKSFFCDNEQTEVALKSGKCIKLDQCLIKHEHPQWNGTCKMDELYIKNNKDWDYDKKLYYKRQSSGYK